METINLLAGWIGILVGFVAGAVSGLFFHQDHWLGGYQTWTRRMMRLGHIAFFGLGFINLAYAFTVREFAITPNSVWPSRLLILGSLLMPLICYLSAFRKSFRHLFPLPVLSLIIGAALFIFGDLLR